MHNEHVIAYLSHKMRECDARGNKFRSKTSVVCQAIAREGRQWADKLAKELQKNPLY